MTDNDYMRKALEQARMAFDRDEVPVGAIVVCNDRIIARGHNLTETLNDVTAHAEMQAIRLLPMLLEENILMCALSMSRWNLA